ncbi:GAF domain-containing sensor histidine kinase [Sphingobacterium luzhongxinii]|uniref:GAF domain-containing sensor histidine kinase n=1 Tax=Sphingobacterium luzhongxinii TaxID=2654181 RepID=UPI0013DC6440|nr:ATP-binding protein [Sphingobacterium sp. xlx-73]
MTEKNSVSSNSLHPLAVKAHGQFIITDLKKKIVAVSENLSCNRRDIDCIIGSELEVFLKSRFSSLHELSALLSDPSKISDSGRTFVIKDDIRAYYLQVHKTAEQLFIWIEEKVSEIIFSSEMNDFTPIDTETQSSIWCELLENIQRITESDNVIVGQIFEDRTSRVIATTDKEFAYIDKLFSKSFISPAMYDFFLKNELMYIPDIEKRQQRIFCKEAVQAIPIEYLPLPQQPKFSSVTSAKSTFTIPIIINKCLWGIVVCLNRNSKQIDYQKRMLCQLLVQNASVRHDEILQKKGIEFDKIIKETKKVFDDNITDGRSLNYCLVQHIENISKLAKADGAAIYHHGVIHTYGSTPSNVQINQTIDLIKQFGKKIFKDNNFRLKRKHLFSAPLPIAGVAALQVADEKDHSILWFRNESKTSLMEICDPVDEDKQVKSKWDFQLKETEIIDTAPFWDDEDLSFIRSLDKMITKAVIIRAKEEARTKQMLITANNELEMITYTLSHDLRNPLSVAKLSAQLLQRKPDMSKETQIACILNIKAGLDNMESLINKTVAFMRSKHITIIKEQVAIHPLLQKLFEDSKSLNNNFHCTLEIAELIPVYGEKATLIQIFFHIIDNSVKFSKVKDPHITISSYQQEGVIIYQVTDNGMGIPSGELNMIKNAFYKGKNALTYPGAGIGLTLVHQLVKMLGGSLTIESALNQGTTVTINFPNK